MSWVPSNRGVHNHAHTSPKKLVVASLSRHCGALHETRREKCLLAPVSTLSGANTELDRTGGQDPKYGSDRQLSSPLEVICNVFEA